ncbi:SIMPL domain-containing protein [Sedimentibacter sp. MB31-C6]|uniref:SIMPL domain-containing protein n=1 Tax=Sedimentibacter sp. MB31-C6 TaxID=3109366 RepID=UPI002DDD0F39|nr:SIMPL domain-containing protein [Sedimentibacter sp. MB36-C1]WSI04450.1 SIMPL domain-containing protein [Sedimentibacter sp. MB36-C1]
MTKAFSDVHNTHNGKTMTLTGHGKVTTAPNIAIIRLGVQTTGENLVEIQSENAQIVQRILQVLQQIGVTDVKTFQYTINKIYDYDEGRQIDRGYSVRNVLEIKTSNLNQVGNIIDASVNSGANIVDLISFDVSNSDFYYQQALNLAIKNAIQKAKSILNNLGIKAEPIPINIIETSSLPPQPFQREFVSTPIVPGNIQTEAFVTVEFVY